MKKLFELLAKVSEKREALLAHREKWNPGADAAWREKDASLQAELVAAERAYQAAETEYRETPDRQEAELRNRIECRHYLGAAVEGRDVAGAEAEFNRESSLPLNVMPWEALEPRGRPEDREDAATTITDEVAGQPQMQTLRRVFQMGNVEYLGVRAPMVAYGEPNFPVMSDDPTLGASGPWTFAPGTGPDAQSVTFTRVTAEPKRMSARYLLRMEDMAKFPSLEDILRSDLRMVMTELRDRQVLMGGKRIETGDDATPGLDGAGDFVAGATATNAQRDAYLANDIDGIVAGLFGKQAAAGEYDGELMRNTDLLLSAVPTFAKEVENLHSGVDGRYSSMASDWRYLFGVETYKFLANLVVTGSDEYRTFLDYLRWLRVGYRVSAFLPAKESFTAGSPVKAATNVQRTIRTARGTDAVAPVWQGITMIRDPYSGAQKAELAITAHALHGFAFLRKAAWEGYGMKLS